MKKPPFIEGKEPPPIASRPTCPGCGKCLQPRIKTNYRSDVRNGVVHVYAEALSQEWIGTYKAYGAFCSLKCCEWYANRLYVLTCTRYLRKKSNA